MDEVIKINTLAEYKKVMKTFVRGAIKSKIFNSDDGKLNFHVEKDDNADELIVTMRVGNSTNTAIFACTVSTRVYNKIADELYVKTIEQFNKLKGFAGMTVVVSTAL